MSNFKKSERTRQEILDTAWKLIADEGADISLSKIANAVGMTRQSIYVHFGSRGGLLIALVRRTDEREKIWEAFEIALGHATAPEKLEALMRAWLDFVPKILPVARDLIRLRSKDEEAGNAWSDRMEELRSFYQDVMTQFEKNAALSPGLSAEKAAHFIWATSSVQMWDLYTRDCGWNAEETTAHILRQTLSILR
ncbi:MAG: TetR/AcrR family transcriptional regulator [Sneathiellales bacterium]|nr:TetR/AcrR family transcriptional regulator [Sneathiellales bacterium]